MHSKYLAGSVMGLIQHSLRSVIFKTQKFIGSGAATLTVPAGIITRAKEQLKCSLCKIYLLHLCIFYKSNKSMHVSLQCIYLPFFFFTTAHLALGEIGIWMPNVFLFSTPQQKKHKKQCMNIYWGARSGTHWKHWLTFSLWQRYKPQTHTAPKPDIICHIQLLSDKFMFFCFVFCRKKIKTSSATTPESKWIQVCNFYEWRGNTPLFKKSLSRLFILILGLP